MSIPAKNIVNVLPSVIGAGGNPLALNGLFLTNDPAVPLGSAMSFPTADAVGAFFGLSSDEYAAAVIYFNGFSGATQTPGQLWFVQYADGAVPAYLRGGSVAAMTLTDIQALSGVLTVKIGATTYTSGTINLAGATSFSNAAALVQAGFSSPALAGTVAYDSQRAAFTITSTATGTAATIGYGSGSLAAGLKLTQATSAVLSQGSPGSTPGPTMDQVLTTTRNWFAFSSIFEPDITDKEAFAVWTNGQQARYCYCPWDTDPNAAVAGNQANFGYIVDQAGYVAVMPVYNTLALAAFALGYFGALNFSTPNGRATAAFRQQDGFAPTVTDEATADALEANGYNFYGQYDTDNDQFNFLYPGQVSGKWLWADSYANQRRLNSQFQLAFMTLLTTIKLLPYNAAGRTQMLQAGQDPINEMLTYGGIQPGVTLSAQQAAEVNTAAGLKIDNILSTAGWYMQVLDASPQVRAQRGTPPCNFWYTDGQSVQRITLNSTTVE